VPLVLLDLPVSLVLLEMLSLPILSE
jgi:hypothetical protein